MNAYESKTNFLRWSDVIKAWLSVYPEPYYFTPPTSFTVTRVSLRPAITYHIKNNCPDSDIDAARLASVWEQSKLSNVNPTTWCLCHKDFNPNSAPNTISSHSVTLTSDTHLHYSVTDETILTKLLDLINAGLISDNSAILHLKLPPELYVRMDAILESYPNIGFESDPATYTYHLL